MNEASLVLGSATPSLESYTRALRGEYGLFTLKERAKEDACLPQVEIVDLREELKEGNRSIFSRRLKALIEERLEKREQVMLFINAGAMPILCPAVPAARPSDALTAT